MHQEQEGNANKQARHISMELTADGARVTNLSLRGSRLLLTIEAELADSQLLAAEASAAPAPAPREAGVAKAPTPMPPLSPLSLEPLIETPPEAPHSEAPAAAAPSSPLPFELNAAEPPHPVPPEQPSFEAPHSEAPSAAAPSSPLPFELNVAEPPHPVPPAQPSFEAPRPEAPAAAAPSSPLSFELNAAEPPHHVPPARPSFEAPRPAAPAAAAPSSPLSFELNMAEPPHSVPPARPPLESPMPGMPIFNAAPLSLEPQAAAPVPAPAAPSAESGEFLLMAGDIMSSTTPDVRRHSGSSEVIRQPAPAFMPGPNLVAAKTPAPAARPAPSSPAPRMVEPVGLPLPEMGLQTALVNPAAGIASPAEPPREQHADAAQPFTFSPSFAPTPVPGSALPPPAASSLQAQPASPISLGEGFDSALTGTLLSPEKAAAAAAAAAAPSIKPSTDWQAPAGGDASVELDPFAGWNSLAAKPRDNAAPDSETASGETANLWGQDITPIEQNREAEGPKPLTETWMPQEMESFRPMLEEESSVVGGERHGEPQPSMSFGSEAPSPELSPRSMKPAEPEPAPTPSFKPSSSAQSNKLAPSAAPRTGEPAPTTPQANAAAHPGAAAANAGTLGNAANPALANQGRSEGSGSVRSSAGGATEKKNSETGGTTVLIRYTCPKCKTQGMQAVDKVGMVVNCSNCGKAMRLVMKK